MVIEQGDHQADERNEARASHPDHVILVSGWIHLELVDETMRERRATERVQTRGDDGPHLSRIDTQLLYRVHCVVEQLILGCGGSALQCSAQRRRG